MEIRFRESKELGEHVAAGHNSSALTGKDLFSHTHKKRQGVPSVRTLGLALGSLLHSNLGRHIYLFLVPLSPFPLLSPLSFLYTKFWSLCVYEGMKWK